MIKAKIFIVKPKFIFKPDYNFKGKVVQGTYGGLGLENENLKKCLKSVLEKNSVKKVF